MNRRPPTSALPLSDITRIWAVSGHRLVKTFESVARELAPRVRVDVAHLAFDDALVLLREQLAANTCDVVVASGSNGEWLRSRLDIPVVLVKVGGYDIITALCTARAVSPRIAVVLHRTVSPELKRFAQRFDIGLEFASYETADDAADTIRRLADSGIEAVVGAGMVADLASQAGLTGVFLYSTDSVREAMHDAVALAAARREDQSRHAQLESVLQHLSDGVVAIDMAGRITTLNPAAARMAGRAVEGATGLALQQVFGGLGPGAVLATGHSELGRVDQLSGRALIVDCMPLRDAGLQTGAVLTLHAPGPMESAVGRLRAQGHRPSRTARYTLDQLVAASPVTQEMVRRCQTLATGSDAAVLILGESGSGKEVVAQGIHRASRRQAQAFVAVNCGGFPPNLLESELFGYEDGAFTGARRHGKAGLFETASGGTLFLDEVGEMPLPLQTRLLRALQEKEITRVGGVDAIPVDVRVVAATHRDLFAMVRAGTFREDLFYRIHILEVRVPPLRDRPEDLEVLASRLVHAALKRSALDALAPEALDRVLPALRQHAWPGNVRELENVAERVAMACLMEGRVPTAPTLAALIGYGQTPAVTTTGAATSTARHTPPPAAPLRLASLRRADEVERIHQALQACNGDRDAAASSLGISRTTLWRKLR